MWGDRLLDGKATGIGEWEASKNGTARRHRPGPQGHRDLRLALREGPRHAAVLRREGIRRRRLPWRKEEVAVGLLEHVYRVRGDPDDEVAARGLGVVQTTWCGSAPFIEAYKALKAGDPPKKAAPAEAARCFSTLFEAVRKGK